MLVSRPDMVSRKVSNNSKHRHVFRGDPPARSDHRSNHGEATWKRTAMYRRRLAIAGIVCNAFAIAFPLSGSNKSASPVSFAPIPRPSCLLPNPDIAGIGGRVSIYAQSALLIAITLVVIAGGRESARCSRHAMKTSS